MVVLNANDLDQLQRDSFDYFVDFAHPRSGLVADRSAPGAPCSIAAMGFGLTALVVGAERGWIPRAAAATSTLRALRFLAAAPQGPGRDAAGHHGFFYHFIDPASGRRRWSCELSTIDTALLMAGVLAATRWFTAADGDEAAIRDLGDGLYRRVEWDWALDGSLAEAPPLCHGWTPERGFIPHRWSGYSEALVLYALALGSPTHPIPAASYRAACRDYAWRPGAGSERLHAAPLFIHQYSHCWLDLSGIHDGAMAGRGLDYAANSRLAVIAQRDYARANPHGYTGYGAECWGFSAGDGPGPRIRAAGRRCFAYHARGAPDGPDDGTIAPFAVAAALPFAPDLVLPTLDALLRRHPRIRGRYGLTSGFNLTVPGGWFSDQWLGIDQGPVVTLLENHRSGLVWSLMRGCPYLARGLRRAGFRGGWVEPGFEE